jgi:glycosyltransferase involved in cell wall biosynthesis
MDTGAGRDRDLRAAVIGGRANELMTQLAAHGAPGFEVDLLDRFHLVDAMAARRYDLVHIACPASAAGPVLRFARTVGVPVLTTCDDVPDPWTAPLYGGCELLLSANARVDAALVGLGLAPERIVRWRPGVDIRRFNPARYAPDTLPGEGRFNILYSGPLDPSPEIELLADSFLLARDRNPRLHLVLVGHGCLSARLATRIGNTATTLADATGDRVAQLFATADLHVSTATVDTGGPGIAEAQASGVPALAVDCAHAAGLIENGRSGLLLPADPAALASALRWLSRRGAVCERLATGGLRAVSERGWESALDRLAGHWRVAAGRDRAAARLEIGRAA